MRRLNGLAGAVAAIALLSATTAAQAAPGQTPAAKLSLSKSVRAGTSAKNASELRGGFIIPLVATIAVIGGIIIATGKKSKSP